MSIRFRIRTDAGQELSFASREMFEDFVRSGDLSPDDLVYDAEDGSWAPARTHPIVLDIEYEQEEAEGEAQEPDSGSEAPSADDSFGLSLAPPREREPDTDDHGDSAERADIDGDGGETSAGVGAGDFGLELAPVDDRSPEEASRQFVEKLESERRRDLDYDGGSGFSGFSMDHSGTLADLASSPDEPEPPPPPPPPRKPAPRPRRDDRARGPERRQTRRAEPAPKKKAGGSGGGVRRLLAVAVVVAIAAGGGYVAFQQTRGSTPDEPAPPAETPVAPIEVEPEPEPPAREPVIARTVTAVRERALERFLTSTQAALRDLQPIPDYWPGGPYMVLPSAHPDIVGVWQSYLTTVQRVRAGDTERYRTAYEAALEDALIEGEERADRLARGMAAFQESAAARAAHYDRVEALAAAAIQSHNALIEGEGLLLYDGPEDGGLEGPIGAGVTSRDEESRLLLDNVVQLLTARLAAAGGGPGSGENVRAWVWDGFLDAVAN
jgi:hypothetical protein